MARPELQPELGNVSGSRTGFPGGGSVSPPRRQLMRAVAVAVVLAISACAAGPATKVTVRDEQFAVVKELSAQELAQFNRWWGQKQEIAALPGAPGGVHYKLDIERQESGGRWLYYTTGVVSKLAHNRQPPFRVSDPVGFNKLIGASGRWPAEPRFPYQKQTPGNSTDCKLAGGDWRRAPLSEEAYYCMIMSEDAGKPCADSSECEGFCTLEENTRGIALGAPIPGVCSAERSFWCGDLVMEGKAQDACID